MIWQQLSELGINTHGRYRGQIKTTCPQCSATRSNKRDRCLSVNLDDGLYSCHHCGWTGKTRNNSNGFHKAIYTKPSYAPAANGLDARVIAWFQKRGISRETLDRNKIEYRQVSMPQHENKEVGAICFPYFRNGEVVNVKYRDGCKHFRMEKNAEIIPYGFDDINTDCLIWVEGEIDKLSIEEAGWQNCVSVPNGANSKLEFLQFMQPTLDGVKFHIIAVDGDPPGQKLRDELIRRLSPEKCYIVTWQDGCKDANDVLIQFGKDALKQAIENARPTPIAGTYEINDLRAEILELYENGFDIGVHPGSDKLAELYRVKTGEWTLVTGSPGSGKSTFLDWMCANIAVQHGWGITYCSPENQPLSKHIANLTRLYTQKPFAKGYRQRVTKEELNETLDFMQQQFRFLMPSEDEGWSIEWILESARQHISRYGIKGLVIDPYNELEYVREDGLSTTENISRFLSKLRRFARTYDIHIWLVAHPKKMPKEPNGQYPVATPYDVADSAHFFNKSDMAISVWRDKRDEKTPSQIHVQKVRFQENGKLGMCELYFDKPTGIFSDRPLYIEG